MGKDVKGITILKGEDVAGWYEQVCLKAEVADFGPSKGSMVIRPRGYFVWESIQKFFNKNICDKFGVSNAYFPLFIPESFFEKEASHAEGFSPEVAWLDKSLTGDGERLAVRPTSETIMYDSYAKWIRSYKDLPLKMNQWCNVVRWETEATKLFMRSREFLWQEGHCVYETFEECEEDTLNYIRGYQNLAKELLAIPTILGRKSEKEKFAGADHTYTIEAFMPDGKALQCGTSHHLGDGFGKAFGLKFVGKDEKEHVPFQNSWGLSTRLIGGMIMLHSDDKGLVLPPKVAREKVVVVPLLFKGKEEKVLEVAKKLERDLRKFNPILDDRTEYKPGAKFGEWEMKGVPLRIEIGPRDVEAGEVVVVKRNNGEKVSVKLDKVKAKIPKMLDEMHAEMFDKAETFFDDKVVEVGSVDEFEKVIKDKGIVKMSWCGCEECEKVIKEKTGASTRCMPLGEQEAVKGKCLFCGKENSCLIYFSRSY
ncbi:proline--tRNA ligase [Methanococcoides sp. SA1]|nr:proline--tRNA ligase [Methanococcoides sp. SA1]